jgi:hypothetical protein
MWRKPASALLSSGAGQRLTHQAGRLTEHAQGEVARNLARRLHSVSERRIEALMLTPARRVMLDGLFWGLPFVLTGSRAHDLTRSVRFRVLGYPGDDLETYWLEYCDGRWRGGRGHRDGSALIITASGPLLIALACGRANPMREYASGRLRVRGNPVTAARLLSIIRRRLAPPPGYAAVS